MLGWGLWQTSSNDSGGGGGGGRRTGTREWGRTGMDEGGTMMMITITVILEGWKSRHALSLVLIHNATDFLV